MAVVLLGQVQLTPLFQQVGTTNSRFLRVTLPGSQGVMPLGWGFEVALLTNTSHMMRPPIRVFPWGGPTGTDIETPSIIKTPVSSGLPRGVALRSINQVGVRVRVFAGDEGDFFS